MVSLISPLACQVKALSVMIVAKRVFLFLVLNFLVILALSLVINVLGLRPYLREQGIDYRALLIFCFIWGMGGAFVSLALSRVMAKRMMGVRLLDPASRIIGDREVVQLVYALARLTGLTQMPEVGVYESEELNAFATGPTRARALVAISSGLLDRMNERQLKGVLGHELSHVANGDMVTMTLLQGVVNAFVLFLSRALAYVLAQVLRGKDDKGFPGGIYFLLQFVLQIVFMVFGAMLVAWASRRREYRADRGGAVLAGPENMISALEQLHRAYDLNEPVAQPALQLLKISSPGLGLFRLFQSHPPLEDRIRRLEESAGHSRAPWAA